MFQFFIILRYASASIPHPNVEFRETVGEKDSA